MEINKRERLPRLGGYFYHHCYIGETHTSLFTTNLVFTMKMLILVNLSSTGVCFYIHSMHFWWTGDSDSHVVQCLNCPSGLKHKDLPINTWMESYAEKGPPPTPQCTWLTVTWQNCCGSAFGSKRLVILPVSRIKWEDWLMTIQEVLENWKQVAQMCF